MNNKNFVILPCNMGDTVYTIREDYLNCKDCLYENEAHFNKRLGKRCCYVENRHCPYIIDEHTVEGFVIIRDKNNNPVLSRPGEWGYEGFEEFNGCDDKCYHSREDAERAINKLRNNL